MVERQIKARGVRDLKVLAAMEKIPRHLFINEEDLAVAYGDHPLSIGFDQTISQPYIVAYMTEALGLEGSERVLEIGTGCGYQTAILSELVSRVYTIEVNQKLYERSRDRLTRMGYEGISFKRGNGRLGWPEEAPFDGIIVTAAPETVPENLIQQLAPSGRMIIPIGKGEQSLKRYWRTDSGYESESLLSVRFVPLV